MFLRSICALAALVAVANACASGREPDTTARVERCLASTARSAESTAAAHRQRERPLAAATSAPAALVDALARLTRVARLPRGLQVRVVVADVEGGASVGDAGIIFVAPRLWRAEPFLDADELAAVLAHELAHVELAHVRQGACEALALAGREDAPLASAQRLLHQAIWAGRPDLALRMLQGRQLRELEADRRAAELLAAIGARPDAMATMLLKTNRAAGAGGADTHPALEVRLRQLGFRFAGDLPESSIAQSQAAAMQPFDGGDVAHPTAGSARRASAAE